MCWLSIVQRFQTLIVGIIGFGGVILTLRMNARLAGAQHDRQVTHETTIVRTALRAELEAAAESYRYRIETFGKGVAAGAYIPLGAMTDVYKSMIARLGLLSDSQVRLVLKAYLLIEQLPERLEFLAEKLSDLPPPILRGEETDIKDPPGHIWIPAKNLSAVTKMHRNYLEDIKAAITALSQ